MLPVTCPAATPCWRAIRFSLRDFFVEPDAVRQLGVFVSWLSVNIVSDGKDRQAKMLEASAKLNIYAVF